MEIRGESEREREKERGRVYERERERERELHNWGSLLLKASIRSDMRITPIKPMCREHHRTTITGLPTLGADVSFGYS